VHNPDRARAEMSGKFEQWEQTRTGLLRLCLLGAAVLVGCAAGARHAAGNGLSDGPVLRMTNASPEKVASELRYEKLNPRDANVTSRVVNDEGLRRYEVTCPLRDGDVRGRIYTIILTSYLKPGEFERRLYAGD